MRYILTIFKGGPYNAEQVREAEKDPWLQQKLAVRKWDDMAKDPELKTQPLNYYREMAVESLRAEKTRISHPEIELN